jgi:hypothetical protein
LKGVESGRCVLTLSRRDKLCLKSREASHVFGAYVARIQMTPERLALRFVRRLTDEGRDLLVR